MAPTAVPRLRLLGRPSVCEAAGRWREFPPGLRAAALGYVALQQRWVARDELVALFWPDRPEATARGNLRPLLAKLAREPHASGFEREPSRVRWPVESDHEALMAAQGERRWGDAWRLARGELLEGVTVARAPEFESWLAIERERLRDVVRTAGLHVADAALEAGGLDDASEVLAALQRLDPLDEAVVRRLMVALARRGARGDALSVYEAFVVRCRDELGAEPEVATSELAKAVRRGREGTAHEQLPAPRPRPAAVLPVPLTPLVGRYREAEEVAGRLADAGCRLLTLAGPGGIGKTRLALEAARVAAPGFGDSARAVDLAAVSSEGAMVAAVAEAVGAELDAGGDGARAVVQTLASRELLLVLDNVEHLASVSRFVSDLLHGAPGVRVLATSRANVGLAAEWRYDVAGLAHRTTEASDVEGLEARVGASDHDGDAELSEAAALFVAAGRRASSGFDPGPREAEVIERIAARLAGSPLAIELAAAWTWVLDVEAIDGELSKGVHLLASEAPDRPPRHASMQGVLEQSWSMLQPREQAAMRRLSVFRGGFDLAAAREVARLELPVLLSLVNKSFLWRAADGRFTRHPLVWRDARERALTHEDELEEMRSRHARYYLHLLAERPDAYHHPDGARMMREIQVDLENVSSAWRWAVERREHDLLVRSLGTLVAYCWSRKRAALIEELFGEALARVPSRSVLHGLLLAGLGSAQLWVGRGDHGVRLLREGVELIEGRVHARDRAWTHVGYGLALSRHGSRQEAVGAYERAAESYRQLGLVVPELAMLNNVFEGSATSAAEALNNLLALETQARALGAPAEYVLSFILAGVAGNRRLLGEFAAAERAARARGAYQHRLGASFLSWGSRNQVAEVLLASGRSRRAEAIACGTLGRPAFADARKRHGGEVAFATALVGRVALVRRDLGAAESWSRRALDHHRSAHGPQAGFDFVLETLARVALAAEDLEAAEAWLDAAGRGPEPRWYEGHLTTSAGRVALLGCTADVRTARGETDAARAVLREALDLAASADLVSPALAALVSTARCFRSIGDDERADRLLRYVRDHPRATFEARSAAASEHDGRAGDLHDAVDDGIDGVQRVVSDAMAAMAAVSG